MGEGRELSVSVSQSQPLSSEHLPGKNGNLEARNPACSEKEAQSIQHQPSSLRTRLWEE